MMTPEDRTVPRDPERTIVMPTPGGQATVVMKRPQAQQQTLVRPTTGIDLQRLVAGINPLLGAANVLLALVAQLRTTTSHADPAGLRTQLLERVKEFEALARANGVPQHQITAARYVLCSFLDEVIAATPWGAGGVWAERNLLQEFHDERWGGDKAFKLLERLGEDAAANRDLLELFYVCLALGFEGRYQGTPGRREQLDAVAERVLELVRPAKAVQPTARTLALRWQGVNTQGPRGLSVLPLWVVLAVGAGLALATYLFVNARLDEQAQPMFRQIHELTAALRVDRSAAASRPRLAPLLRSDIASGAIEVRDEAARSVVTLPADTLFAAGGARLEARQLPLLGRVAQALKSLPGVVVVVGHTDNASTASLQFPTNWHLSRERAQAVMSGLVQQGLRADLLRAEGRADAEPRAPNATPSQREHNRRIEIELLLPRPQA